MDGLGLKHLSLYCFICQQISYSRSLVDTASARPSDMGLAGTWMTMQSSGSAASRNCVACGRPIAWDANVCQYCGHDYRSVMAPQALKKSESMVPVAAGVLILLSSIGYLILGGLIAAGSTIALPFSLETSAVGIACGIVVLLLGLGAFMGGVYATQRKHWTLAVIGGIIVLPTLLGLLGLILVIVSKDEFTS